MSLALPFADVADTAFVLASLRAIESSRSDALFHDPLAARLAGDRGPELVAQLPGQESSVAGCVVRTCLIDELLFHCLKDFAVDTVINLGAGFDTRPYRLDFPRHLRWIEVDSEEVLCRKVCLLESSKPHCPVEFVALDLKDVVARSQLLRRVASQSENALVITEGLIVYLEEDEVRSLATDLYCQPTIRWWLSDVASMHAVTLFEHILRESSVTGKSFLRFAPANGVEFFRSQCWITRTFRSSVEEGRRLNRSIIPDHVVDQLDSKLRDIVSKLTGVVSMQRRESVPAGFNGD